MLPTGLKGTEHHGGNFISRFQRPGSPPAWRPAHLPGATRGPCAEKPPLGQDTGLRTLGMQPGGADPASGSGGFQVAAGPVLRSRPSASLPYSGPACFARGPRFRASRLGSSVLTPSLLPAKCVPVCPGMNTHTPPRACTHTHVHAHTGTRVVWSRSSARIFLLPGTPAGGETARPAGAGDGPRACRLTGWTWSRLCSTAGRRSGGRTPRAGAPGHTSGSGPRRRRLKASSPASVTGAAPHPGSAATRGNPGKPRQACRHPVAALQGGQLCRSHGPCGSCCLHKIFLGRFLQSCHFLLFVLNTPHGTTQPPETTGLLWTGLWFSDP